MELLYRGFIKEGGYLKLKIYKRREDE